jgi:hypothetical protein
MGDKLMTQDDIEHLAQVAESVFAQLSVGTMSKDDFDGFLGRMLWAIHASNNNPRFSEPAFRVRARGEQADLWAGD